MRVQGVQCTKAVLLVGMECRGDLDVCCDLEWVEGQSRRSALDAAVQRIQQLRIHTQVCKVYGLNREAVHIVGIGKSDNSIRAHLLPFC